MIIYYYCTRDSALLLSFLLTCHPYFPFDLYIIIYNSIIASVPGLPCFRVLYNILLANIYIYIYALLITRRRSR